MTDANFLKAMHIKPESFPASGNAEVREPDLTPNVLIDLDEDGLRTAAINWCNQARAQYQENQVLRTRIRKLQDTVTFLVIAAGVLTLALIGVCWGCL